MTRQEPTTAPDPVTKLSFKDRVAIAVVSCCGLGYSPVASGTAGTLGGVAVVLALTPLREAPWFHFGGAMLVLALAALGIGVLLGRWAERHYRGKDPSPFVLDELAGYWVTLFRWEGGFPAFRELAVAFLAFRLFDVLKPWPGRRLEHLPHGWGIMLDDLAAGVWAWLVVSTLRSYLGWA